jgi:hypothetical protein
MDVRKIWDDMEWINLTQDREHQSGLVNSVNNLPFPLHIGKLFSSCTTGRFSRRFSSMKSVSYFAIISAIVTASVV